MSTTDRIVREAKLFTFYARKVWPFHRRWVRKILARRCTNCMASERQAALDESGLCAACRDYRPAPETKTDAGLEPALNAVLREHQGRGRQFDALVLYSGGKDSTFMIHRIQKAFPGLRMLALTLDNTFMSPVARENVHRLIPRLGVSHMWFRPPDEFMVKLFRYGLTHLNADGCYGTVDFSDGEFTLDTARNVALRLGIPLILCGYSKYQVEGGLRLKHFEEPREGARPARTHVAGLELAAFLDPGYLSFWWQGSGGAESPRMLFPLYAWDVSESHIRDYVRENGLLPIGANHPMVTNHLLIPLLAAVDVHRAGYTSFEPEFCRMVREGKMRAGDWLPMFELAEYAARTGRFVRPAVCEGLRRLQLTPAEVGLPGFFAP